MYKSWPLFILAILAMCSCGGNHTAGEPEFIRESRIPELLFTVPSDALVVMNFDKCSKGMTMLVDSTASIARLDLSGFQNSRMALSYVFTGRLIPVLALDAGKAAADTTEAVKDLMAQADSLGLRQMYLPEGAREGHRACIILSTSEAALPSVDRHIETGASILDAPDFLRAVTQADGRQDMIYFRNSGADKTLPRNFLSKFLSRRQLTVFVQKFADWTLLDVSGAPDKIALDAVRNNEYTYFANLLDDMESGESKLAQMLPAGTDFAIDLIIEGDFRERYEDYLDASVRLDGYKAGLAELKESSGISPTAWEKENRIREVAIIHWNNRKVLLVRPAKSPESMDIEPNPYAGFVAALYGNAFTTENDLYHASAGHWIISGSEPDVETYINSTSFLQEQGWPSKDTKFVVYRPGDMVSWTKKGFTANLSLNE